MPSELFQAKSETFLERLRGDLVVAEQRYKDISSNVEEYLFVRSFIDKELEFEGRKYNRKVMMNFGKQVYARATVKANAKLMIRVQDDLFIQMSYERALTFIAKRIEFLNGIASECLKDIAQIKGHITMTYAVLSATNLS